MKVCTDACLFGALAASQKNNAVNCLDIGTGTGLLSLMFAQKNNYVIIDAIEIELNAVIQALENTSSSPWHNRIKIIHQNVLTYNPGIKYDCIISNPPFFENSLTSPSSDINNARHNLSLPLNQLIHVASSLLSANCFFAVLLPFERSTYCVQECKKNGLFLNSQITIKQTVNHKVFRSVLFFSRTKTPISITEIAIKDECNEYTKEFENALKDYYLNF